LDIPRSGEVGQVHGEIDFVAIEPDGGARRHPLAVDEADARFLVGSRKKATVQAGLNFLFHQ
jgi:hypothetical protein